MNKVTNVHGDKKVTSLEEDKLRAKTLKVKGLEHLQEGKGNLENLVLKRKGRTWLRCSAMVVKNMGTREEIVLKLKGIITRETRKKLILSKKWKILKQRSLRRRK